MHRPHLATLRMAARAADLGVLGAVYCGVLAVRVWLGRAGVATLPAVDVGAYLRLLVLLLPAWWGALEVVGSYRGLRRTAFLPLLSRVLRASALATVGVVIALYALHVSDAISRAVLFGFALVSVPAVVGARWAMVRTARRWLAGHPAERLLLVGAPADADPVLRAIAEHPEWGVHVVGLVTDRPEGARLPVLGGPGELEAALDAARPDHVLAVGGPWDTAALRDLADTCEPLGVRFSVEANFLGLKTSRVTLDALDGWAMITFSSTPTHAEALAIKRALDILVAGLGLVLLAPVLLVAALLIRREDGGPVLFRQTRAGLYGRPFTLLKLRSMVVDAEARREGLEPYNEVRGPAFKMRHDPRVTRIGRFLRRFSLDELPQLVNVLRGDMSLVGPRPPLPAEVARYERWQLRRLSMRPGITGLWQVSGRSDLDFDTWMKLDLAYIDTWSLGLDMRLIFRTFPVVLRGDGAR